MIINNPSDPFNYKQKHDGGGCGCHGGGDDYQQPIKLQSMHAQHVTVIESGPTPSTGSTIP